MAAGTLGSVVGFLIRLRGGSDLRRMLGQNPWLGIGLVLGGASLRAPMQLLWFHLRARFSPLTALTLLAAIRLPRRRAVRVPVICVFAVTVLAIEARNAWEFRERGAQVQEYVSGIEAVEAGASVVPVENLEEGPKYRDNLHSWAY